MSEGVDHHSSHDIFCRRVDLRVMTEHERTPLLSLLSSDTLVRTLLGKEEEEEDCLAASAILGERLPYSSYTNIGITFDYDDADV